MKKEKAGVVNEQRETGRPMKKGWQKQKAKKGKKR